MSYIDTMPELHEIDGALAPIGTNGKPVQLYDWEDHDMSRQLIFDDVKSAMEKHYKRREHNGVALEITDLHYVDPESYSLSEQKHALHNDEYLSRRLRGTVTLSDANTGEVLDKKKLTLMRVPYLTGRGTFIREGNEWGTINQTRLIPGAYAREQKNGDLEMQFNVRPGTGNAFRVNFNPESAIYKFNISGSNLHLYSLLHDLGVPDEVMEKSWGPQVFKINKDGYDSRVFEKAYMKIAPEWDRKKNPSRTREDKTTLIKNALNRAQIATNVANKTLPNRIKSACWASYGDMIEKCAGISTTELRDIAAYINKAMNKHIDIDAPADELEQQVLNVIRTGMERQTDITKVDDDDYAAAYVRRLQVARENKELQNKIDEVYMYGF